jgi:hypothetical protein
MNLSINSNTAAESRKPLSARHVAAACGALLAAAAIAGLGMTASRDNAPTATTGGPTSTLSVSRASQSPHVFYIVGSQEDAIALESAINTEAAHYAEVSTGNYSVFVVGTPEQEASLIRSQIEQASFNLDGRFVDLRDGSAEKPSTIGSVAAAENLQQLAAGELWQYGSQFASPSIPESLQHVAAGELRQSGRP